MIIIDTKNNSYCNYLMTHLAEPKHSTVALRAAGTIPARKKCLYSLHIVGPGLGVCVVD